MVMDGRNSGSSLEPTNGSPSLTALVVTVLAILGLLALVLVLLGRERDTTADAPETALWPWATSSTRFEAPVAAARSFATDFLGFTNPVVGSFAQGDARSGEVEVRPRANGPVTTVLVRQGGDGSWWVVGADDADIVLDEPDVLDGIRSPVRVRGTALAFEGTVQVHVREDGRREPLGEGFVTGGALVLFTRSADDGQVWQAEVVRVRFASTGR